MHRAAIKTLITLAAAMLLAACGFQLRGQSQLPFATAYVDAPAKSILGGALRQALAGQGKLAPKAEGASVRIKLDKESRTKTILALSGGGKVREYRLEYRVLLSVSDDAGKELSPPSEIHLNREFTYNDQQILAKETEEASLNRAMEQEALSQALRRLTYLNRR